MFVNTNNLIYNVYIKDCWIIIYSSTKYWQIIDKITQHFQIPWFLIKSCNFQAWKSMTFLAFQDPVNQAVYNTGTMHTGFSAGRVATFTITLVLNRRAEKNTWNKDALNDSNSSIELCQTLQCNKVIPYISISLHYNMSSIFLSVINHDSLAYRWCLVYIFLIKHTCI